MTAYLVVTAQIHDRERFLQEYAQGAAALTAAHGGEYLVRAPGIEILEGQHPGGSLVISKWPDAAAARRFWNSAEYARLRTARAGLADCQVLLIEG